VSLARDTVRGALWTISSGVGSRVIGLVGTLAITRFVAPAEYGEVTVAAVLGMSANQLSTVGWGQYLVSHPNAPRSTVFHVTVFHICMGVLALGALLLFGRQLAPLLDAPHMTRYLPGIALSVLLDRFAFVPERILVRDLRFGRLSATRTAGDLTHTAVSLTSAALGLGGAAIVLGNVLRSFVRLSVYVLSVNWRDWLSRGRIDLQQTRALLAFGVPMSLGALCEFATRRWDNLLVSRFFGPGPTGMYNLAYNLADVPAIQIGEQIGDVLLPSFARMDAARRPDAFLRALSLLGLVVFPLAVGLGVVAPALVATLFDARWAGMGSMLAMLSALSLARPVGWTVASYLQARQLPRSIFMLEAFKLLLLLAGLLTFGRRAPLLACAAVGVAFAGHALASLWLVRRVDGITLRRSLGSLAPALLACLVMAAAVQLVEHSFSNWQALRPGLRLCIQVAMGTVTYAGAAALLARRATHELRSLLRLALRPQTAS
jgi:PST family polysaccharide transporter